MFYYYFRAMKLLLLLSVFLTLLSCSNKISPAFKSNIYTATANTMVVNDGLMFSHRSYGDVDFTKDEKALKSILKQNRYKFDNVLVYGKTNTDPIYEYVILADSKNDWKTQHDFYIKDTVANNHTYTFIGISHARYRPEPDFKYLSGSFKFGDNYNKGNETVMAVSDKYSYTSLFYTALTEITNFPVYDKQEESIKLQLQLTYASFLGTNELYDILIKGWEKGTVKHNITEIIKEKGIRGIERVMRKILEETKDRNVVMFNENHFYPNNRKLVSLLLPQLKAQGFKYLALEALDETQDSLLNAGKAIKIDTGFYTKEQNYRQLITAAQDLGYSFVAYESHGEGNREEIQAANLYTKTIGRDKNAKVLVLAGIDHINEVPGGDGIKRMSAIFKEKYNIDPLTFSQTGLAMYRYNFDDAVIVNSDFFTDPTFKRTDFQIVNNLSIRDENINFEYSNTFKEKIQLNIFEYDTIKNTYISNVPYRACLVEENETLQLHLSPGAKKLIVLNKEGKVIEETMVKN